MKDRNANGHHFGFGDSVCTKCGMNRVTYQDSGKPACKGTKPSNDKPLSIEE